MRKLAILSIAFSAAIFKAQAQDSVYIHKDMGVSLGLTQGIAFHSQSYLFNKSKISLCCQTYTQGMYLRRYINNNIALETSIVYGAIENKMGKTTLLSLPLTAQYFFNHKKKLRPYIGAGIIYNQQKTTAAIVYGTDRPGTMQKTRNTNLQLSQGITYNISTKIEINESIHIVPKTLNNCSEIGMEIGIGFKIH